MGRCVLMGCFAVLCLGAASIAAEDFVPTPAKARLESGGVILAPSAVAAPPREGLRVGGLRIVAERGRLLAHRDVDGAVAWTLPIAKAETMSFLGVDAALLYGQCWVKAEDDNWRPSEPRKVERLDVAAGKWLEPLVLPGRSATDGAEPGEERVWALLSVRAAVLVLSGAEGKAAPYGENLSHYRVTCFREAGCAWTREFEGAGEIGGPSALRLGGGGPSYAAPGAHPLSVIHDDVIVCAGGGQDILALDLATGADRWRLPAVWEFERGFVGPSIWQHFLSRAVRDEDEAARARLRSMRRIVAGPFAVPHDGGLGTYDDVLGGSTAVPAPGYRLFVAVARNQNEESGGYLADAVVYEVNHEGTPIAIVPMPRMVTGGMPLAGEVLWACEQEALGATAPSFQRDGHGMGDWSTDHVGRLAWYRQPEPYIVPEAWMRTGRTGPHLVIDGGRALSVPAGGYVLDRKDRVFRLPVQLVDLETGARVAMLLSVPFAGTVPRPEGNYGLSTTPDGGEWWTVGGPHALAIVGLEVHGSLLDVTLAGAGEFAATLTFDLSKVR
ncbi:MAG: hypothetical protein MUE73_14155 [Planctomycetes bacterium]|nr:hypothetical protein [Planctomycetota bacterium]